MPIPSEIKSQFNKAIEHLKEEISRLKSGQAVPSVLEGVEVEAYGTRTPLAQLASINNQGPRTLIIQPWDQSIAKEIEKAIISSNLGLNPISDKNVIRINFPQLTEESRKETVKLLHEKLEQAKVSIRKIREEYLRTLKSQEREGAVSEDDYFEEEKELQKEIDNYNGAIKELGQKKEEELMTI